MPENPLTEDLVHVLKHTGEVWKKMRGKRLFITGGTGFFGCWLLESFIWANEHLDLGAQVVVLTRSPQAFIRKAPHLALNPCVRLWQGDIGDFEFPPGEFAYVIHAATEASARLNEEEPLAMLEANIAGTRRALEFAAQQPLEGFLFTSSGAVYGRQPPELRHVPESYPCTVDPSNPRSAYAVGKICAEHLCALYLKQHGTPVKIARCFAFVGPYLPLDIHFAIGNFIRDALNGGPIIVKGDGTPYRSYLYAADLAIWLWTILVRGEVGRAYNVGSEEAYSIREVALAVAGSFAKPVEVKVIQRPKEGSLAERYVPSSRRMSEELSLEPRVSFEQAIRKTIAWHLYQTRNTDELPGLESTMKGGL